MSYARAERAGVVAAMRAVGPDAPTLCAGWRTRDLAAHLVVRERRLDAAPGILIAPLAGYTERVQRSVAEREWDTLLDEVADGPPIYSPLKVLDRWANLAEMFIHHEDVLRGALTPDAPVDPRPLPPDLQRALVTPLKGMGAMSLKSVPAAVTLCSAEGKVLLTGGRGPQVRVTGTVGELLLFVTGRKPVEVSFDGDPTDISAVQSAVHGF